MIQPNEWRISTFDLTSLPMRLSRTFDLLYNYLEKFPKEDCLAKKENGKWVTYSTQDVVDQSCKVSLGLMELGIQRGDRVAIISMNRPEWNIVDFGIQQMGAVSVPMYPTITAEDFRYIFEDSGVKAVFVANQELYDKAVVAAKGLDLIGIYTFDELPNAKHWLEVQELGKKGNQKQLEEEKSQVKPGDLLTLIYTSGTTGKPKGVMLTHNNLMSNVNTCNPLLPVDQHSKVLSFLPLCHVFERMIFHLYMSAGVSVYYAESMETIGDNLKEVQPHFFSTVPRLLEKVYDKIYAKGAELTGLKRKLFFWALDLAMDYKIGEDQGPIYNLKMKIARKLIFSKWHEALGGNVRAIVTGSAALQPRLTTVFWGAGIPVLEGYGLTETSPVISVNRYDPKNVKAGSVGPLIDGVEVKIAEDGEILVKGPNIMKGYYNKPEATEKALEGGWFHTGDIGEFVDGKYLKITDRKKDQFKTSGGKYIYPQLIENKFKESQFIEQVMVIGEGRRFPSALIVPNFEVLKEFFRKKKLEYVSDAEAIAHPEVEMLMAKQLERLNKNFAQYEKIKQIRMLPKLWTVESGELTPTLKCKRKVIKERYNDVIEDIYNSTAPVEK